MLRVTVALSGAPVSGGGVSRYYFPGTVTDAGTAHSAVVDFWESLSVDCITSLAWSVDGIVEQLDPTNGALEDEAVVDTVSETGTKTLDPTPFATQALIQWRTGVVLGGRRVRGRTFVPGMHEDLSTNGVPVAGLITRFEAAANSLVADGLGIWSKTHGQLVQTTGASMWSKWATLRSRRD